MSDRDRTAGNDLATVEARLRDMRKRKDVRWSMSQQTAEMAIAALAIEQGKESASRKKSAKARRRKKGKRLL